MKAQLIFNLDDPDDKENYEAAMNGSKAKCALFDIGEKVFRPARKHGYEDLELQKLVQAHPQGEQLVGKLEELFYQILEEWEVKT